MQKKRVQGFTLIELLVVIGIIAILAAIVLVAVNPARQFAIARDTTRRNDLYQVLNALYQYAVDYNGDFPSSITATPTDIGSCGTCLRLDQNPPAGLVATYIPVIPYDPLTGDLTNGTTDYVLFQETSGRLTATATSSEITIPLTLTR